MGQRACPEVARGALLLMSASSVAHPDGQKAKYLTRSSGVPCVSGND